MSNLPGDALGQAPAPKAAGGSRRLLMLVFTVFFGVFFGLLAGITFAALAGGLVGVVPGLVIGLLLTWVLPTVLAVRADRALKRQRRPLLLRRVVSLFLVVLVQVTFFLAGFFEIGDDKVSTSAVMARAALPLLGPLPVLGGMLEKHATDGGALARKDPVPGDPTKPDPTTPTDPTKTDPTTPATTSPAGLSPRAAGRPIANVAAVVTTDVGGLVLISTTIAFGGAPTVATTDLSAFADKGVPTRVESSADGHVAVVLAGQHLLTAAPGKPAVLDAALSRGAKLGDLDVQSIRDVAMGPGGALLLAIDAFDTKKSVVGQALVARPAAGAAFVVRRFGTTIEGEKLVEGEAPDVSHGYAIKRHDGHGHVVVEEIILEDDTDVGTRLDGAQYAMNPRRLLVGTVDNPRALAELVRTGDTPSGIEGVTLQGFADAAALPDGRVVFDGNFVQDGPRGWLFAARLGGSAFAVAPELVGKPEAPFAERAPRTAKLSVEPEGGFAFVNRDGALVISHLQRLSEHKVALLRADAVTTAGRAGAVSRVNAARLLPGAEWILANVELLDDAGQRREALILASTIDLAANKAEVIALEGSAIPATTTPAPATPTPATPAPATTAPGATAPGATAPGATAPATTAPPTTAPTGRVKSLFVLEGHDEPLWGLGG